MARREKKMRRLMNQARLFSYRTSFKYKFGVKVPMTHAQAMKLDDENDNDHWAAAEELEIWELNSLTAFKSIGKGTKAPDGYRTIPVFFVQDVP